MGRKENIIALKKRVERCEKRRKRIIIIKIKRDIKKGIEKGKKVETENRVAE